MQVQAFEKLVDEATKCLFPVLFCHRAMNRAFLLFLFLPLFVGMAHAQNEHFEWLGLDAQPLHTDSIELMPYSGEANDFSGGYAVGDTVGDFHLWTLNGEEFLLSNEVEENKPTILFNGSATCVRFQNDWDQAQSTSPPSLGSGTPRNLQLGAGLRGRSPHTRYGENCPSIVLTCPSRAPMGNTCCST